MLNSTVRDYMDARAEAAMRINPRLEGIYEDIAWQQTTQFRLVLENRKGFGPVKLMVCDILLSDDEQKIRDLFNPTNQVSILTEIVQEKEEAGKKTAGNLEIHDMPTMYRALDPSLEKIVLLIQCWIWWDLEDAVDICRFNQGSQMVMHIDKSGVPEQLAQYYAEQFRLAAQQVSPEVIIAHELAKCQDYMDRFLARRAADEGHRIIIKREPAKDSNPDMLIRAIARQYVIQDQIREKKDLDPAARQSFGKALGLSPEEVTPERVIAATERAVTEGKARLKSTMRGEASGRPYDYKQWQAERMQERFNQLKRDREPQKLNMPKQAAAAHR
jgi:hypothetical protein